MKKKLSQNLALKAISVVLAFVIWLMVVNVSQPEVSGSQLVEIKVENANRLTDADKTYKTDTRNVRISYRVRLPQQSRISAENFHAYIDLADYSVTGAVPVYVDVDDSVANLISDVSLNPMVVHVDTEDIQRKRFDIVTATKGRTAEGYMAGEVSFNPDYVYVTGPVSEVGQISEVGIEVDVTEANSALTGEAPIHFYDANGNEIKLDDRVSANRETISYELPVYRIKSLSIVAEASGTPAEGYALEQVETNPAFVDVYGDEAVLSQYTSIRIPASEISVNGASATVTHSIDITKYLPEGLRLAQPGTEISIAARIRKLPETTEGTDQSEESTEAGLSNVELPSQTAQRGEAERESSRENEENDRTDAGTDGADETGNRSGTGTQRTEEAASDSAAETERSADAERETETQRIEAQHAETQHTARGTGSRETSESRAE